MGFRLTDFFTRHPNAANLLMAVFVLCGLTALGRMNTQFFPTVDIPVISISIVWPGASAEDIERNILDAIEPEIRALDGVKKLTGRAYEGVGRIDAEFIPSADMQKAVSDVEGAVARITTLPQESEKPVITRVAFYENIASLLLTGPFSEAALKSYAKLIRDDLLSAGVDKITFSVLREEEIWVDVTEETLRRFSLTPSALARRIGAAGNDAPSGTLAGASEKQLRSLGRAEVSGDLADMEIIARADGRKIFLGDIASIIDGFDEDQPRSSVGGAPAVRVDVSRAAGSDVLVVSGIVDDYLASGGLRFPASLQITRFDAQADLVRQRIAMLLRNAAGGLVLVLAVLFLFLNSHIAFWVAAGIPIAMIGSLAILFLVGEGINMISLFAFLMMLGITVDDAIVVGEHSATLRERGMAPREAAGAGAAFMVAPVLASSLTTIAAFLPVLFLRDILGEIMRTMAIVVIVVIIASLIESFLILPGHLRDALRHLQPKKSGSQNDSQADSQADSPPRRLRGIFAFRRRFNLWFDHFRAHQFIRFSAWTYDRRYFTSACALGVLVIAIGMAASGRAGFRFFPSPEGEAVTASFVFAPGTPRAHTENALLVAQEAMRQAEANLRERAAADGERMQTLIRTYIAIAGQGGGAVGDNRGEIFVELTASESRTIRTNAFVAVWREALPPMAGLEHVSIKERRAGPPGRDIDIRLEGGDLEVLKQAAEELRAELLQFSSLRNIEDNLPYGKKELVLETSAQGHALGFTAEEVGRQLRGAQQGAIARRFARGDEEVTIRVRLAEEAGKGLRDFYVTAPDGRRVALSEVVNVREERGFASITRRDGRRGVVVAADASRGGEPPAAILAALGREVFPRLQRQYGVSIKLGGQAEEQQTAFADLLLGLFLALSLIYLILAWIFGRYGRPLAVMAIIPFGFIGAVFGHMVMGYDLTILTMIALLGLSGILVNDSIVLVTQIEKHMESGYAAREAVIMGARDRLRAVILTSVTTVFGLLPLLFERSLQAQFLKPIAITISFGVGFGTFLVLIIVPALFGMIDDAGRRFSGAKKTAQREQKA